MADTRIQFITAAVKRRLFTQYTQLARSVADGVTNTTTTVTSATAAFTASDVGATIVGTGIPALATIASVTNATTVIISAAATASASGVSLTITRTGPLAVAAFATQFVTDWASVLPNGGLGLGVVAKPGATTVAEIVVAPGICLEVPPSSFVGQNFGVWEIVAPANMGRTVTDGATNTNTTVTSATAAFASPADVGAIIAGPGIPSGTTIASVTNSTTVVISAAATATATNQPLTISPQAAVYIPDVI